MGRLNYIEKNEQGFSVIELVVVIAISSALMVAIGFSVFYFQRNALSVEQAGQELAGEIRVLQSKILAVQSVNGIVPKAIVIELRQTSDIIVHYVKYLGGPNCTYDAYTQNLGISNKATLTTLTPNNPIYISYISPSANFIAIASGLRPTFTYKPSDNSCYPTGSVVSSNPIVITLNNGSQDYYVKIDTQNGSVTPTPN